MAVLNVFQNAGVECTFYPGDDLADWSLLTSRKPVGRAGAGHCANMLLLYSQTCRNLNSRVK